MAVINSIPTSTGVGILESELKSQVSKFALVGSAIAENAELDTKLDTASCSYADIEANIFYTEEISRSYYDANGVLSFEVFIPHAEDFREYLYAIALITDNDEVVVVSVFGSKFQPIAGFGMVVTIKTPINGEAGEVVFKSGNWVLESEFEQYKLEHGARLHQVVVNLGNAIL